MAANNKLMVVKQEEVAGEPNALLPLRTAITIMKPPEPEGLWERVSRALWSLSPAEVAANRLIAADNYMQQADLAVTGLATNAAETIRQLKSDQVYMVMFKGLTTTLRAILFAIENNSEDIIIKPLVASAKNLLRNVGAPFATFVSDFDESEEIVGPVFQMARSAYVARMELIRGHQISLYKAGAAYANTMTDMATLRLAAMNMAISCLEAIAQTNMGKAFHQLGRAQYIVAAHDPKPGLAVMAQQMGNPKIRIDLDQVDKEIDADAKLLLSVNVTPKKHKVKAVTGVKAKVLQEGHAKTFIHTAVVEQPATVEA